MKKIIFIILLSGITLLHFANQNEGDPPYQQWYQTALAIYKDEEATEADEINAIKDIDKCINFLNKKHSNDSILYDCYIKGGSLVLGLSDYDKALSYFNAAIEFGKKNNKPDSVLFPAYLFSGRTYYALSNYDSAYYQYKKAEEIADTYKGDVPEKERLYNVLGVIHYDFGNSSEAIRYFNKAVYELKKDTANTETNQSLYLNYKVNILTAYIKLKEYHKADSICNFLLRQDALSPFLINILYYKKTAIALARQQPNEALNFIKKVDFKDRNSLLVYDYYAKIFSAKGQYDEALKFVKKEIDSNKVFHNNPQNLDLATAYQTWGNILATQNIYNEALVKYQTALIKLLPQFNDTAINSNPQKFLGTFSAITLLQVLQAKAETLKLLYNENKNFETLKNSVATYKTYFELTRFLEQSYSSDEAKLFLAQQKGMIHDEPIQLSLQLYELTKEEQYYEDALYFDDENKNILLNSNRNEQEQLLSLTIPDTLTKVYEQYKRNITTISLKLANPLSDSLLNKYQEQLNDYEILLAKTKQKIDATKGSETQTPHLTLNEIKKQLSPKQCILSYHLFNSELTIFYIDGQQHHFLRKSLNDSFYSALQHVSNELRMANNTADITVSKQYLFSLIIKPFEKFLANKNEVNIIPDNELHTIPFEVLEKITGEPLLYQYAINYVYAARYLFAHQPLSTDMSRILVLAPFAKNNNSQFGALPYTNNEIQNLNGVILKDQEATRENLIKNSGHAEVLHLATHAKVNDSMPSQSFIVLYPQQKDSIQEYMYSSEIANLKLSNLKLVYLSACESGTGKLIKGEGLMSLSRSFANAGCNNIVTSLWKADDISTAYITQHFYSYLKNGESQIGALQKAKLDYLKDPSIEKRKKTPYYWAHLIHIGQLDNTGSKNNSTKKILLALVALLALVFVITKVGKATSQ
jgi:CHAT domain-containing protein/tetratricopeptide (TPR) repeat protein